MWGGSCFLVFPGAIQAKYRRALAFRGPKRQCRPRVQAKSGTEFITLSNCRGHRPLLERKRSRTSVRSRSSSSRVLWWRGENGQYRTRTRRKQCRPANSRGWRSVPRQRSESSQKRSMDCRDAFCEIMGRQTWLKHGCEGKVSKRTDSAVLGFGLAAEQASPRNPLSILVG